MKKFIYCYRCRIHTEEVYNWLYLFVHPTSHNVTHNGDISVMFYRLFIKRKESSTGGVSQVDVFRAEEASA